MPNIITRFFNLINNSHSNYLDWQSKMQKNKLYLLFTLSAYIPASILSGDQITTEQNDALIEATGYNRGFNRAFLLFGIYETIIFTTNLALSLSQKYINRPQLPNGPANTFSRNFNNTISKYILLSRAGASIYAITHAALSAQSFNKIMQENHSDAGANNITFLTYFGIMSLLSSFCVLTTCLFCCAGFYPCRHPEELRENPNQDEDANPRLQPNNALARPLFNAQPFNNGLVEIDVQGLGGNQPRRLILNHDALDQFINRNVAQANPPQINPEIISQIIARVTQRINAAGLLDNFAHMQDRPNAQRVSINNASDTHPAVIASVICAVCLNQITVETEQEQVDNGLTSEIATLDNCGHQYHRQCLVLWDEARRSRADCPTCRAPFTLTPQV
jgi:hypothetical protein